LRGLHLTRLPFHEDTGVWTRGFDAHPAAPWDWAWITGKPSPIR